MGMQIGYGGDARNRAAGGNEDGVSALAYGILEHARESMLVDLRFLEPAFSQIEAQEHPGSLFAVDGATLFFDAGSVVRSFAEEPQRILRDYMHMVLHCLFRHPFSSPSFSAVHWDLACDMAVEGCLSNLGLSSLSCRRESLQRASYARLSEGLPYVTAEMLYYRFLDAGMTEQEAIDARRVFFVDDHAFWVRGRGFEGSLGGSGDTGDASPTNERTGGQDAQGGNFRSLDDAATEDSPSDDGLIPPVESDDALASLLMSFSSGGRLEDLGDAHDGCGDGSVPSPDLVASGRPEPQQRKRPVSYDFLDETMREKWREISLRADVSLDDFSQLWGSHGGEFSLALKRSNVERVDYGEFLRRFVSRDEQLSINDEEFDYVYYCYGLDVFGNMPLIEPLEYTDDGRIRDFAIAIDTSASTKGETVFSFVERTYDILQESGLFADELNIYLIQCDAQIQDVVRIRNRADIDAYLENLELKGLGGTDFRPVFSYVDELVESGELAHLKGLLYFTDGQGAYPRIKPKYDVAFVLTDEAYVEEPDVPPWAMRVKLDSGEFRKASKGDKR